MDMEHKLKKAKIEIIPEEIEALKFLLKPEINRSLQQGSMIGLVLAFTCEAIMVICMATGITENQEVPIIWVGFCAIACIISWRLAVSELAQKMIVRYLIAFTYTSLPTLLFVISHFYLPSGAATYINGPPVIVYLFVLVWAGFFFDKKICSYSGLFAGLQYIGCFFLAEENLKTLHSSDSIIIQDLTTLPMFILTAVLIYFTGLVVGVLSENELFFLQRLYKTNREVERIDGIFGDFVSPEVKKYLLNDNQFYQAKSLNMAVLFADIRNFTAFCETNYPSDVIAQLNEYFDRMVQVINSHGGVVDKFIGDAVMANFGGLRDLANPCQAALDTAVTMRRELRILNQEWSAQGLPQFKNGIGIHYGNVLQGPMGSQHRKEFTIFGDTVNLASRLEGLTKRVDSNIVFSTAIYLHLNKNTQERVIDYGFKKIRGRNQEEHVYGIPLDYNK